VAIWFLFVHFFDLRRFHGLGERKRRRVPVIGRGLATLLHVGFRFEHQQVAAVDVVAGPAKSAISSVSRAS
jgi:hypothetical protein